jgi:sugar lactone lactonase YvrE
MFFADLTGLAGRPDGAAVDRDGHYWVAGIDGGCLYRFAPGSGAMVEQRMLPVRRPSKPAFFGARLERMAVTSFAEQDPADPDSLDGALLGLDPGVPGVPVPPVAADAA